MIARRALESSYIRSYTYSDCLVLYNSGYWSLGRGLPFSFAKKKEQQDRRRQEEKKDETRQESENGIRNQAETNTQTVHLHPWRANCPWRGRACLYPNYSSLLVKFLLIMLLAMLEKLWERGTLESKVQQIIAQGTVWQIDFSCLISLWYQKELILVWLNKYLFDFSKWRSNLSIFYAI